MVGSPWKFVHGVDHGPKPRSMLIDGGQTVDSSGSSVVELRIGAASWSNQDQSMVNGKITRGQSVARINGVQTVYKAIV